LLLLPKKLAVGFRAGAALGTLMLVKVTCALIKERVKETINESKNDLASRRLFPFSD